MSDLVKTISSWQVCANSYTHTHSSSHRQRERDTWRTLSWVSSAWQPVSVSVAVTVSIAIATTSKGNSRPNHPKYPICPQFSATLPPHPLTLLCKNCCACILCICMHSEKGYIFEAFCIWKRRVSKCRATPISITIFRSACSPTPFLAGSLYSSFLSPRTHFSQREHFAFCKYLWKDCCMIYDNDNLACTMTCKKYELIYSKQIFNSHCDSGTQCCTTLPDSTRCHTMRHGARGTAGHCSIHVSRKVAGNCGLEVKFK